MDKKILDHFLQYSTYTHPWPYKDYLQSLPDDITKSGNLVCHQVIHRVTLKEWNTNANRDKRYGDMDTFPRRRLRCDDDVLMTAVAMIAELERMDSRLFVADRIAAHKIVVGCRYVAVLMAAILKSKWIPARARAGFGPYFATGKSRDHRINEYRDAKKEKRISIDADWFFDNLWFNQYDIPKENFDRAGTTWLTLRAWKLQNKKIIYADGQGTQWLKACIRAVFYDFHALMNNEISYEFQPAYIDKKFEQLQEKDFEEIDTLATLLLDPDTNFHTLIKIRNTEKKFRILNSPLVGDESHKERNWTHSSA